MEKHPLYSYVSSFYDLTFSIFLDQGNRESCEEIARRNISDVLEIGIGTGFSLDHYQKGTSVKGVDLSASMLGQAQKRARKRSDIRVDLAEMDAQALSFPNDTFGCVFLPSILTVVPKPEVALSEAVRVLKPGGLLLAICHLVEESHMPKILQNSFDPLTRKFFGFTMQLSDSCFKQQQNLKIETISATNYVLGYPLSLLVRGTKNAS